MYVGPENSTPTRGFFQFFFSSFFLIFWHFSYHFPSWPLFLFVSNGKKPGWDFSASTEAFDFQLRRAAAMAFCKRPLGGRMVGRFFEVRTRFILVFDDMRFFVIIGFYSCRLL